MPAALIAQTEGFEDQSLLLLGTLYGNSGALVTQASLSSITFKVYDQDDADALVGTQGTLVIADTIFDTLQTADPWDTAWGTGYNFRYTVAGSCFPTGGRRYWIEFTFDPVMGDNFFGVVEHTAIDRKG